MSGTEKARENSQNLRQQKSDSESGGVFNLIPKGYVGFDCLPEQYVNRTIRNGIVFNVLIVGATGVGKSTLIDSLFNTTFNSVPTKSHKNTEVELNVSCHELQEKQIKLKLNIVETKGFADQINKGRKPLILPATRNRLSFSAN